MQSNTKKYIRYEIRKRNYSSNVVVGVHMVFNKDKGKEVEESEYIFSPFLIKSEGDGFAQKVCDMLNSSINE